MQVFDMGVFKVQYTMDRLHVSQMHPFRFKKLLHIPKPKRDLSLLVSCHFQKDVDQAQALSHVQIPDQLLLNKN